MNKKRIITTATVTFLLELLILFTQMDIKLISDWVGEMAFPVSIAGLDWSHVFATCSYYGWGLTWIFAPLFMLTDNSIIIYIGYRVIQFLGVALISVIAYILQVRYMGQKENCVTMILSSMLAMLTWIDYGKEFSLMLGIWCAVLLLMIMLNTKYRSVAQKLACSVVLGVFICYTKNFHERATAIIIVSFLIVFVDYFILKRRSVYISAFLGGFFLTYVVSGIIKQQVFQIYLEKAPVEATLYNTSAFQTSSLWFLESLEAFEMFCSLIWSNYHTLILWSYGFALIGTVIFLFVIVKKLYYRINKSVISKSEEDNTSLILGISLMMAAIVIVGVAVNWGSGLYEGATVSGKAYNYYRYYFPFIVPGILATVSYCRSNFETLKRLRKSIIIFFIIDIFYFLRYFYPFAYARSVYKGGIVWSCWYILPFMGEGGLLTDICIWLVICLLLLLTILWVKNEKRYIVIALFIMYVTLGTRRADGDLDTVCDYSFTFPKVNVETCDATYSLVKAVEDEVDLTDSIYVVCDVKGYNYLLYTLQFMLNRYTLHFEEPSGDSENVLLVVKDERTIEYVDDTYDFYQLDENEYIYVKGEECKKAVRSFIEDNE